MLAAQNKAYLQLYADNLKMSGSLAGVPSTSLNLSQTNCFILRFNRKAFDTIVSRVNMSYNAEQEQVNEPPPLKVKDYPAVKFWYKDQRKEEKDRRMKYDAEHNIHRPKGHSSKNENIRFWFLEKQNGTTIDGVELNRIHAEAKTIWDNMCNKHGPMELP